MSHPAFPNLPLCPFSDGEPAASGQWCVQNFQTTKSELQAWAKAGQLRTWSSDVPGARQPYYSVDDLIELARPIVPIEATFARGIQDESVHGVNAAAIIKELSLILRETRMEKRDLHQIMLRPLEEGIRLMCAATETMQKRCENLETGWFEWIKAREELLSRAAERDLMKEEAEQRARFKERAIDVAQQQVPAVINAWAQQQSLRSFLAQLGPEELAALRSAKSKFVRDAVATNPPNAESNGAASHE